MLLASLLEGGVFMFETFDDHRSRYASGGIVQTLPGELIDSIWLIIELGVDLPYRYSDLYPQKVYVYDDGQRQTILLPSETR